MIRTPVSGIPVYVNRAGKGVKVMRTAEGVSVKTFVKVAAEEKDDDEDIEEAAEVINEENTSEQTTAEN
jgi:hypothetical protein